MSHLTRMIRFVRHWHARIGVLAAVLFLILASTGLMLNHTDALQLARRQVSAPWLMAWYGLQGERPAQGFLLGQGYLVPQPAYWLMDGRKLPADRSPVVGAVEAEGVRYVATAKTLVLLMSDGTVVDTLRGDALPGTPLQAIGVAGQSVMVKTPRGNFLTQDGMVWEKTPLKPSAWSAPESLTEAMRAEASAALAPSLPLERVLLDLHSGRLFGKFGPWLMDLAAVVMVMLSLSGVWIYLRSLRKKPH